MSTEAIIVLVVAAIVLIALFVAISRSAKMREKRRIKQQRDQAATQHREAAQVVHEEATQAEVQAQQAREQARRAEEEAQEARERASLHEERAELHERGLADHELRDGSGDAQEGAYADTARGDRDPRDERSTVVGDERADTPGADSGRFSRDDGVTRTDVDGEPTRSTRR